MVLNINKPLGISSYDVIRVLKQKYPNQKIGHAGTLDPLADGVLICLVGKEFTKLQSQFMGGDKVYKFDVLFGFETDSYDILGLVSNQTEYDIETIKEKLPLEIEKLKKLTKQQVPAFSAVKKDGVPLYRKTLDKKILETDLKINDIEIKDIKIDEIKILDRVEIKNEIFNLLQLVKKGFRNIQITECWEKGFSSKDNLNEKFILATITAHVTKGTYVRSLANILGKNSGVYAITTKITRLKSGEFDIKDSLALSSS